MAQEADKQYADPDATDRERSADREGFLTRWSRRKQAARAVPEKVDDATSPSPSPQPEPGQALGPEVRELTDQDMPPVESLDENSDYSGFLSPKVSDELRRLALRKLFHLPQFNVTDGLDDYAEDYTAFKGLGGIITHEMRRLLEQEKARALAADGELENKPPPKSEEESTTRTALGSSQRLAPSAAVVDTDAPEEPTEDSV